MAINIPSADVTAVNVYMPAGVSASFSNFEFTPSGSSVSSPININSANGPSNFGSFAPPGY
jgi:hypothetical protein